MINPDCHRHGAVPHACVRYVCRVPDGRTAAPGFACFCLSWAVCAAPCQAMPIHAAPCHAVPIRAETRGSPGAPPCPRVPCACGCWRRALGPWARAAWRGGGPFPRRSPSPRPRPRRGADASMVRWSWERLPELVCPDPRRWLGWAVPRRDDGSADALLAARLIPAQHGTVHPGAARHGTAQPSSAHPSLAHFGPARFSPLGWSQPSLAQFSPPRPPPWHRRSPTGDAAAP